MLCVRAGSFFCVSLCMGLGGCIPSLTARDAGDALDAATQTDANVAIPEDGGDLFWADAALPPPDVTVPNPPLDGGEIPAPDAANGTTGMDAGSGTQPDTGGGGAADDAGSHEHNDCQDDDALTRADWVGFCGDRVDDNCRIDAPNDACPSGPSAHNYCRTGDEPCPSTQPASAAPSWNCTGTPPANVIAYAQYSDSSNVNVTAFCAFVYESTAFPGEHYVAVNVTNGSNVRAAQPNTPNRDCQADTFARRHFYLSNLDEGDCPDVKYIHAYANPSTGYLGYPVDDQQLSNGCRKMIRNIGYNDPAFAPDIQYFAASREEALGKLAILERAEVNCIGIDNLQNQPYRTTEQFYVQASAPVVMVQP